MAIEKQAVPTFKGRLSRLDEECTTIYVKQQQQLWTKANVVLNQDVIDYASSSAQQKRVLDKLMLSFTSLDLTVGSCYRKLIDVYSKNPKNETHVINMLTLFEYVETIHNTSYSHLSQTLGFSDEFYDDFATSKDSEKLAEVLRLTIGDLETNKEDLLYFIYLNSGVIEGITLMSIFSILLMYSVSGKFEGFATINRWSIRDENLHIEGNALLFHDIIKREFRGVIPPTLVARMKSVTNYIIEAEREMLIDLLDGEDEISLGGGDVTLTVEKHMKYCQYLANLRTAQFGINEDFIEEPYPDGYEFLEVFLESSTVTDFFSSTVTDYVVDAMEYNKSELRDVVKKYKKD